MAKVAGPEGSDGGQNPPPAGGDQQAEAFGEMIQGMAQIIMQQSMRWSQEAMSEAQQD